MNFQEKKASFTLRHRCRRHIRNNGRWVPMFDSIPEEVSVDDSTQHSSAITAEMISESIERATARRESFLEARVQKLVTHNMRVSCICRLKASIKLSANIKPVIPSTRQTETMLNENPILNFNILWRGLSDNRITTMTVNDEDVVGKQKSNKPTNTKNMTLEHEFASTQLVSMHNMWNLFRHGPDKHIEDARCVIPYGEGTSAELPGGASAIPAIPARRSRSAERPSTLRSDPSTGNLPSMVTGLIKKSDTLATNALAGPSKAWKVIKSEYVADSEIGWMTRRLARQNRLAWRSRSEDRLRQSGASSSTEVFSKLNSDFVKSKIVEKKNGEKLTEKEKKQEEKKRKEMEKKKEAERKEELNRKKMLEKAKQKEEKQKEKEKKQKEKEKKQKEKEQREKEKEQREKEEKQKEKERKQKEKEEKEQKEKVAKDKEQKDKKSDGKQPPPRPPHYQMQLHVVQTYFKLQNEMVMKMLQPRKHGMTLSCIRRKEGASDSDSSSVSYSTWFNYRGSSRNESGKKRVGGNGGDGDGDGNNGNDKKKKPDDKMDDADHVEDDEDLDDDELTDLKQLQIKPVKNVLLKTALKGKYPKEKINIPKRVQVQLEKEPTTPPQPGPSSLRTIERRQVFAIPRQNIRRVLNERFEITMETIKDELEPPRDDLLQYVTSENQRNSDNYGQVMTELETSDSGQINSDGSDSSIQVEPPSQASMDAAVMTPDEPEEPEEPEEEIRSTWV